MFAKELLPEPPQTIELAAGELAGKTEIEQLVLLSFWRKENVLTGFSNQKLDELYLNNPTLFEDFARLSKGNSSVVRAVCLEVLRRHRNFSVELPLDDMRLTKPINSFEEGLLDRAYASNLIPNKLRR
jgi:hypothetical protein